MTVRVQVIFTNDTYTDCEIVQAHVINTSDIQQAVFCILIKASCPEHFIIGLFDNIIYLYIHDYMHCTEGGLYIRLFVRLALT